MIEFVDSALYGVSYVFAGWRFLISARFRESTHKRWESMRQMEIAQDVAGGVAGVMFSILLPLFVWWSMRPPQ
jgi:hypothetical protein